MNIYRLDEAKYSTHGVIIGQIGTDNLVLDVGCNSGYLGVAANQTNTFYGVDIDEAVLRTARMKYVEAAKIDLNSFTELPWDIKFDVIVFADVLEHTFNPGGLLKVLANRYLAEDGRIIVSLPNIANWQIRLALLFGRFEPADSGIMDRTHLHFYTIHTARLLLEASGLTVIRMLYGSDVFGPAIRVLPILGRLLSTSIILVAIRDAVS